MSPLLQLQVFQFLLNLNAWLRAFYLDHAPAFLFLLVLVAVFCVSAAYGESFVRRLRRNWVAIPVAVVLAGILFALLPPRLKVLSDETNLLSVSEMIARDFRAANIIEGFYEPNGHLHILTEQLPTRPLLFPFLTACLHWIRGVSPDNVFALNFLLTVALLVTVWMTLAREPLATRLAVLALIVTNPVFATNATSGGFDLCSFVFGAWTFLALWLYLARPAPLRFAALLGVALCFANVRYESLIIFPFLLAGVSLLRWRELRRSRVSLALVAGVCVLLLPALAQRYLTWGRFENPVGRDAFNWRYIFPHGRDFLLESFLSWRSPYPFLTAWAGVTALLGLAFRGDAKSRGFWRLVAVYLLLTLGLVLAHHAGDPYSPTQVRLFLPMTVAFAWVVGWAFPRWLPSRRSMAASLAVVLAIQMPCSVWSILDDPPLKRIRMSLETEELRRILPGIEPKGSVFAYERPGQLISLGFSGVLQKSLVTHGDQLRQALADGRYPKLYELKSFEGLQLIKNQLDPVLGWRRELVRTVWSYPNYRLDLYELIPTLPSDHERE